ncbi:oligosaccharide flippase family protein [Rhodanobacter sp. T12-5]|uniref:lipopolysaccharide biosynthesis protein n=1 Tax=Rhodanobacter sp. T12-5 TaxID=2024611 RepID=UPI001561D6A2|nr:oligosaccharide flippase family protein [Rhodanobacter sp. T12-5]
MSIAQIKQMVSWRPGQLARNTAHASGWNILRIALQASSLILMARILGAEGYGKLAGTVALYVTFAQFAGLGSGIALVRHLARAGELHARMSATQRTYLATGMALFVLIWPLSILTLGGTLSPTTLAFLACAELVVAPMLLPLAYRHQAEENMFLSGAILTLAPFARFLAVLYALVAQVHDVAAFAPLYLGWLTIVVSGALCFAWPRGGDMRQRPSLIATIREGLPYVISGVAVTAGGELDKTILLRSAGGALAGQYAAAYRIMQAMTLPVNSLIMAVTPRQFAASGPDHRRQRKWLFATTILYSTIAASFLWLLAPYASLALGNEFQESSKLLRFLCLVIVTNSVRQVVVMLLTTGGMQAARNVVETGAVVVSVAAMLILIPIFSIVGAITALIGADGIAILFGLYSLRKKDNTA